MTTTILVIVGLLIAAAILFFAVHLVRSKIRERSGASSLRPLAEALGLELSGNTFRMESDGISIVCRLIAGTKRLPSVLEITAGSAPAPPMRLGAVSTLDRFGLILGAGKRPRTNDETFDKAVYVESDLPRRTIDKVLIVDEIRSASMRLIEGERRTVVLGPEGVSLLIVSPGDEEMEVSGFREAVMHLSRIAESIPALDEKELVVGRSKAALLLSAAGILSLVLGILFHLIAQRLWPPLDYLPAFIGLAAGFAVFLLSLLPVFLLLRGRSTSLRNIIIVCLILLAGLPLLGMGGLLTINGLFGGEETVHLRRIMGIQDTGGKGHEYLVMVSSWREGEETLSFEIPDEAAEGLVLGDELVVRTARGGLGWDYLVGVGEEED